ncbi:MAG: BREX-4 system phosphatase PglZ [Eubacterium sp.]|nr:BREX-4 system phosphatase PglZ [Eubacterium sp.]
MDVEAIKQKIIEDKCKSTISYRRYPVRFLFMEMNNNTQEEIQELVKSGNGELLDLSDYLMKKNDGWMTKTKFIHVIRENSAKYKDTYVLGFSELIRFYSRKDIESTVLSLFDIENFNISDSNNSQRRIIFICFSMMDNIYKVLQNSFARKDLLDPFLNSDYELTVKNRKVCFVSSEFSNHITKNKIVSSVDWLGLWRSSEVLDFSMPIWCCSESLYAWHQKASPDNAFQIDIVYNAKDYLEKACNLTIDFVYRDSEANYWDQLCAKYAKDSTSSGLSAFATTMLGIDVKSIYALAAKWLMTDSQYEKWFIKCYVVAFYSMSFLAVVFKTLKNNSKKEFLISVWQNGYWLNDSRQLEERIGIIKELNKYASSIIPEKEIHDTICEGVSKELSVSISSDGNTYDLCLVEFSKQTGQTVEDMIERLKSYYLRVFKPAFTGLSNTEKEFVINLYSNRVVTKEEIKVVYPSLYSYAFGIGEEAIDDKSEWKHYLQAYRESKIADEDNLYLFQYYTGGRANATNLYNMYYDLQRQETLVAAHSEGADVYVLDGVGAEYIPLIIDLIALNGYEIEFCDYAACHLPSITDVNKEYLSAIGYKEWFLDFDQQVIHGEFYKSAVNLRKAFDILAVKIREIIQESFGKRIVITSDHGATARAKWTDTKKKYNFDNADHEGRCCTITSKEAYEDTVDYIVYEDEGKPGNPYLISLNETSLYNRPKYENHGGATVEEMLVPVIVAVPQSGQKKVNYRVIDDKTEVSGLDKNVRFAIIPDPEEDVYIMESDGTKHLLVIEGNMYEAELSSGKEQDVIVTVANKEYKFHVVNKAKKNMEGDDGFDD